MCIINFAVSKPLLPLKNNPEIAYLTSEIKKLTKKITGKKLPSAEEQFADLKY